MKKLLLILFWWALLFLLLALEIVYTRGFTGVNAEVAGIIFGSSLVHLFEIVILAMPLYVIVGLISKKWGGKTMMIIITALTILGCFGFIWGFLW